MSTSLLWRENIGFYITKTSNLAFLVLENASLLLGYHPVITSMSRRELSTCQGKDRLHVRVFLDCFWIRTWTVPMSLLCPSRLNELIHGYYLFVLFIHIFVVKYTYTPNKRNLQDSLKFRTFYFNTSVYLSFLPLWSALSSLRPPSADWLSSLLLLQPASLHQDHHPLRDKEYRHLLSGCAHLAAG